MRLVSAVFTAAMLIAASFGSANAALSVGASYAGPATLEGSLNSSGETAFGKAFASGSGSFENAFTFAVNTPSQISALAAASDVPPAFQIDSFQIALIEGGVVGTTFSGGLVKAIGELSGSALEFSFANLAASTQYALVVVGDVAGSSGGFYGGSATVSAVPLPPAALLFLSALLALAGVVRHRRKKTSPLEVPGSAV